MTTIHRWPTQARTYTLPGVRRKLRTTATRQYLIVSVMDGCPKVETSTDDENAAAALMRRYRRDFHPDCELFLLNLADPEGIL